MTDNQLSDRDDVRDLVDRLTPSYARGGDTPFQIVQRAAESGDAAAKRLIASLAGFEPATHQDYLFWNR